jgi:energy-coupling factor transporter transmembrane protein EcfT
MLHPAARIGLWGMFSIFLQMALLPQVALAGGCFLLAGRATRMRWRGLARRAMLLLVTLFCVVAYGLPGTPVVAGISWLPAREGLAEAGLQVLRLTVFLGSLAWLLARTPRPALMGGLWFLLRPFRRLGLPLDKSIVRLSLVLECVERLPDESWKTRLRRMLTEEVAEPLAPVRISLPPWRRQDSALLAAVPFLLGGLLCCG